MESHWGVDKFTSLRSNAGSKHVLITTKYTEMGWDRSEVGRTHESSGWMHLTVAYLALPMSEAPQGRRPRRGGRHCPLVLSHQAGGSRQDAGESANGLGQRA